MAKESNYFQHDYNTRTDPKIKKLVAKHKMLGYGVWWAILEDLYNNNNILPTDFDSMAFDLRCNVALVKSIICDFELFKIDENTFSSPSIQKRLDKIKIKSTKAKESIKRRWVGAAEQQKEYERNTNVLPPYNERNTTTETLEYDSNTIKEKKSKVKEIKEKKKREPTAFVAPSLLEFVGFFTGNGYRQDVAERAWNGYNVANWFDSQGSEIKSWKQKCHTVWFKEEHRIAAPLFANQPMHPVY